MVKFPYRKKWLWVFFSGALFLGLISYLLFFGEKNGKDRIRQSRENKPELTRNWAEIRSSRILSPVKYSIKINFSDTGKQFTGEVKAQFRLTSPSMPLTFDFKKGVVNFVKINGKEVSFEYNGSFITVDQKNLIEGENKVLIGFKHDYTKKGAGLSRIEDPEDGRVYFYTNFEPYDANQLFPCFDQPDIKASYELEVKAPKNWEVISTKKETSRQPLDKEMALWKFPQTPIFSTYIFPLHAGPFKKWVYKGPSFVPLRLFARQSIAKHVKIDDWFPVTAKGLDFFNDFFHYLYPFEKYDQIIISYKGAMENVGAVTFSEVFVKDGLKTQIQREILATVIYHEMAHMWFGNLVTMKWWDGLWLNESFASYMSYLAMESLGFSDSWIGFNGGTKQWAYRADQLVTTHPIESSVANTSVAFSNFDGISYGKGASVLKQLNFYIGLEKFQEGLKTYFKTHEFGNTSLEDFIKAMEKSHDGSLGSWKQFWLETSGVSSVEAKWSCKDGQMTPLILLQKTNSGVTGPHRMKIALFKKQGNSLIAFATKTVTYSKDRQQFNEFSDFPCPNLVFPNYGDYDFVKVEFDPTSLKTLMTDMPSIKDPLSRQMAVQTLWQMVQDRQVSLYEYTDLMLKVLLKEKHLMLIENFIDIFQFKNLSKGSSLFFYLDGLKRKEEFQKKYLTLVWKRAKKAKPGSDEQLLWTRAYINMAHSLGDMKKLEALLTGKIQFPRLKWSQSLRWNILQTMSSKNYSKASILIEKERLRDPSLKGKIQYIVSQVVQPDPDIKINWFEKTIQKNSSLSHREIGRIYGNLFPEGQNHLRKIFLKKFMNRLPDIIKGRSDRFLVKLSRLTPVNCHQGSHELLTGFLNRSSKKPHIVVRTLRELLQENDKCMNVQAFEKD